MQPTTRGWRHRVQSGTNVYISRTQLPLRLHKHGTLHGVQGKTAEPGLVAHWRLPRGLSPEARWLAHYVILSRPRRLSCLRSYGLPDREILEQGPPPAITEAFNTLFEAKIASTKEECRKAREVLGWPAIAPWNIAG